MTDRNTRTKLNFTTNQIVEALRAQGWVIPDPATETVQVLEQGGGFEVRWQITAAEPTP